MSAGVFEEVSFLLEQGFPSGPQSQLTEQGKPLSQQVQLLLFISLVNFDWFVDTFSRFLFL